MKKCYKSQLDDLTLYKTVTLQEIGKSLAMQMMHRLRSTRGAV
jgi:hypothetical protein